MLGSFATDRDLSVLSWDEGIEQFTGRPRFAVLGRKYYEVLPRIVIDDKDAVSSALETGKTVTLKSHAFRCLFGQICADISVRPLRAAGGVMSAEVSIAPHSTCSVAQTLQKSQQFMQIGRTASSLAHGVRNPLNAIKGAVVYLSEKYAGEAPLTEFMAIITDEITRLDGFVSKFLSTSVSDAEYALTDVNELLKRLEVYTSFQARVYNVTTCYEYGIVTPVMVNTFQIEQAILNVINNALEAMHDSGGRLTVKVHQERYLGREHIVISITDTGPGVDEDGASTLAPGLELGAAGKGFGLFIAREILQYYGGHLDIRNRTGSETTVRLFLPVEKTGGAP